jgi:hypothetical protein
MRKIFWKTFFLVLIFITPQLHSQIEPVELSVALKNNSIFTFGDTLTTKWNVSPNFVFMEKKSGIFAGIAGVVEVYKPRPIEFDIFAGWMGNIGNNFRATIYGGYDRIGYYDLIFANLSIVRPDSNSNLFGKIGLGLIIQHPFNLKPQDSIGLYNLDGIYIRLGWNDPYDTELNQYKIELPIGLECVPYFNLYYGVGPFGLDDAIIFQPTIEINHKSLKDFSLFTQFNYLAAKEKNGRENRFTIGVRYAVSGG